MCHLYPSPDKIDICSCIFCHLLLLCTHLVGSESRIIQLLYSIFHVFITQELHNTSAIFENIGKTNITSLTHMVFQILPTS